MGKRGKHHSFTIKQKNSAYLCHLWLIPSMLKRRSYMYERTGHLTKYQRNPCSDSLRSWSLTLKCFLLQKILTLKSYSWWGRVKKNCKRNSQYINSYTVSTHTLTHNRKHRTKEESGLMGLETEQCNFSWEFPSLLGFSSGV